MATATGKIQIEYEEGLHARPAAAFAHLASSYNHCDVKVTCNEDTVNGKSIMSLLTLGAGCGSELIIEANGEKAQELVDALIDLVRRRFDISTNGT
ncbi:HPr family phosphocarrier protein [Candidatus Sumerlaeota bacterium]|nr:HPr family phosphocarrier protein [Candidatus Sumerlaeota bacterium]